MEIIKYGVGIDISKSSFTTCICSSAEDGSLSFSKVKDFSNKESGFKSFLNWVEKETKDKPVFYVMEATGVYYEHFAYYLHGLGKGLHVALPSTTKHYLQSLNIKSKTDSIDSKVLAQFACERKLSEWNPPKKIFIELRALTRYLVQLKEQRTVVSNRLHSKECSYGMPAEILKEENRLLRGIDKGISRCEEQIRALVATDDELCEKVEKLSSIKGLGFQTVVIVLAETLGFEHFYSKKQVASYAGYDVTYRESGTSVKGRTKISKKGNSYIRKAMYFPAIVAAMHNKEMKSLYTRVSERRGVKKIAAIAVARKLLELMYILHKKNEFYLQDYEKMKTAPTEEAVTG